MSLRPLPYFPETHPDELLSSWVERIGLFYGGDRFDVIALLMFVRGEPINEKSTDLDGDRAIAEFLRDWTGVPRRLLPQVFDPAKHYVLGPRARLAYCPACWDDDVTGGRQPYVRSAWVRWAAVHCETHGRWLASRRPLNRIDQSSFDGWADTWRSKRTWSAAIDRVPDEQFANGALAFSPDQFRQPRDWKDFGAAVRASAECEGCDDEVRRPAPTSILAATFTPAFARLRRIVKEVLLCSSRLSRIDECDIVSVRDAAPLWIENRIVCQVIAAECIGIRDGGPALVPQVRHRLESEDCVRAILANAARRHAVVT